jgi:tRNA(fMet)-specific endonuclease VapC
MTARARYLLDTDTVSDLVRNPQGHVAQRIAHVGQRTVFTNVVVAAELRYGARKLGSDRLTNQVNTILEALDVAALEPPVDEEYAGLRFALDRAGTPIEPNDMLIAAHALAVDATLVSGNAREFSRVPGLRIENWLPEPRKPRAR